MMPPSPLLSARMMSATYLSDTTSMMDHKMVESPPGMLSAFSGMPWPGAKVSLIAYKGLVPMSSKTALSVAKARTAVEKREAKKGVVL